jgi:hypothetical protein
MEYEKMGKIYNGRKIFCLQEWFIQENLLHSVFDRYNEIHVTMLLMSVLKSI